MYIWKFRTQLRHITKYFLLRERFSYAFTSCNLGMTIAFSVAFTKTLYIWYISLAVCFMYVCTFCRYPSSILHNILSFDFPFCCCSIFCHCILYWAVGMRILVWWYLQSLICDSYKLAIKQSNIFQFFASPFLCQHSFVFTNHSTALLGWSVTLLIFSICCLWRSQAQ